MRVAFWNIQHGAFANGYDEYSTDPDRLPLVRKGVIALGADTVCLIDTYRWADIFTPAQLCEYFGYQQAYSIDLESTRVDPKIGITVLTNEPTAQMEAIWLGTCFCVKITLEVLREKAAIYAVYWDDLSEDIRLAQAKWTVKSIRAHPEVRRCCVGGDLNALPPEVIGRGWRTIGSLMRMPSSLWAAEHVGGSMRYGVTALGEIARSDVIPWLRSQGLTDLGRANTAPTAFPRVGHLRWHLPVDRIFTSNWSSCGYRVWPITGSDHWPVTADLEG